ncbi:glycine-rich cell wall structural protein 2-like [Humulus lupulus]|uniref:glycine-rich cell wall structural protein 2-like n=1 Tax=Humulus lupulus TaxID=3486 RepID=UPI002B418418|nr:glycine-rich cell wall structural protein 2-like [Humulus lupulus]
MNSMTKILFTIFLLTAAASLCHSIRPGSDKDSYGELKHSKGTPSNQNNNKGGGGGGGGGNTGNIPGGFFGPGPAFNIPGFGNGYGSGIIGGGYGSGFGGPSGGRSRNGVVRPTVVCKDKGPCYQKKLTCPAKCFTSYSRSGKGYGGGGGGGGCTMDCKKKCVAYC